MARRLEDRLSLQPRWDVELKELDPDGPAPVAIAYRREPESNFSIGVRIRCYDSRKRQLRTVQGDYVDEDEIDEMAERTCTEWSRQTGHDSRPQDATP